MACHIKVELASELLVPVARGSPLFGRDMGKVRLGMNGEKWNGTMKFVWGLKAMLGAWDTMLGAWDISLGRSEREGDR